LLRSLNAEAVVEVSEVESLLELVEPVPRRELARAEALEIFLAAPRKRNDRREALWPSQVLRKAAESSELREAAVVVELKKDKS